MKFGEELMTLNPFNLLKSLKATDDNYNLQISDPHPGRHIILLSDFDFVNLVNKAVQTV